MVLLKLDGLLQAFPMMTSEEAPMSGWIHDEDLYLRSPDPPTKTRTRTKTKTNNTKHDCDHHHHHEHKQHEQKHAEERTRNEHDTYKKHDQHETSARTWTWTLTLTLTRTFISREIRSQESSGKNQTFRGGFRNESSRGNGGIRVPTTS